MSKLTILLASLFALVPMQSSACSCSQPNIQELFLQNGQVFVSRIGAVEADLKQLVHGQTAKYAITLEVVEVLKGRPRKTYSTSSTRTYSDPRVEEIILNSCDLDLRIGDEFIVFRTRGERIILSSCGETAMPTWRLDMAAIRNLAGEPR